VTRFSPTQSRWYGVSVLLTYSGENSPRDTGSSEAVRSTVGDGDGGIHEALPPGTAPVVVVMTSDPPPSNNSARVILVQWVNGASSSGNGG
jgi:hypothetical protein